MCNFVKDHFFLSQPKLLYPCIVDITSDANSSKLVLELLPASDTHTNPVLGIVCCNLKYVIFIFEQARGRSTIAVEWDFSYDTNVFDEFKITKSHLRTYSTKCWQSVANGLKLARKVNIGIRDDGVLLIQIFMIDTLPDGIYFLYYMYPLVDTS